MVKLNIDFTPRLKELEDLTKKPWMTSNLSGSYQSVFKGSGKEFDGFSVYTSEQDSRNIDWKASAKSEKILMRNYVEERNLAVTVVYDCSSSMFFSSTGILKAEFAAEIANSILFAVSSSGDKAGLYMSSEKTQEKIPAKTGKNHYFRLITELSNNSNYGGRRDIISALATIFKSQGSGVIFIISDFIGAKPEELELIGLLRKSYEVFVFVIRDPMEKFLPKDTNAVAIEDYESGRSIVVNLPQVRNEYMQLMQKDEARLEKAFLQNDVAMMKCYTHKPYETVLMEFFERKKKQWS